jgi:ubiquitin carboxyl-terminal hydrolase 36/42
VSTTFQQCQDLILDIEHVSTLDDALEDYFSLERLDGGGAYSCRGCNKKVVATKKFSLEKDPQVVCIQFKRFVWGGKIKKRVTISERLDITRFLCPSSAQRRSEPLIYNLVSMITHSGSSVESGHYTAVAGMSGHYFEFDDDVVRPMSLLEVLDTDAYILLYEREPRVEPEVSSASQQSEGCTTATRRMKPISRYFSGNTDALPVPPGKDRDSDALRMQQPALSRELRPQPSPQQQEPSAKKKEDNI